MAYAIIRTAKLTTNGNISASIAHNNRERECPNADPELTPQNEYLVKSTLEEIVAKTDPYMARKDNVRAFEVVMTASPEYFHDLREENIQEWKQENIKFLEETFGKDNIVNLAFHRDESTPHLHAHITPIVEKEIGKKRSKEEIQQGIAGEKKTVTILSAKEWLGGREKLRTLQNEYAISMEKFGLERGKERKQVHHVPIKEYYTRTAEVGELNRKVESLQATHDFLNISIDEVEKVKEQISKEWKEINKQKEEIAITRQSLNKEINILLDQKATLSKSITDLQGNENDLISKMKDFTEQKESLNKEIQKLFAQKESIDKTIKDFEPIIERINFTKSQLDRIKEVKEKATSVLGKTMLSAKDFDVITDIAVKAVMSSITHQKTSEKALSDLSNASRRLITYKTLNENLQGENEALKAKNDKQGEIIQLINETPSLKQAINDERIRLEEQKRFKIAEKERAEKERIANMPIKVSVQEIMTQSLERLRQNKDISEPVAKRLNEIVTEARKITNKGIKIEIPQYNGRVQISKVPELLRQKQQEIQKQRELSHQESITRGVRIR